MAQLSNKTPEIKKTVSVDKVSTESPEVRPATPQEVEPKSPELDKEELERLRQEVLEEVDTADKPEKKPTALPTKPVVSNASRKSQELLRIESLLEEDLVDVYLKMPPQLQTKFKTEGEKAAAKIDVMVQSGKAEGRKIFKIILKWMKLIPGVNKFFLKQEAKIKTDKILSQ